MHRPLPSAAKTGAIVLLICFAGPAVGSADETTIRAAHEVLSQFLDLEVKQIPASMLADAHGVAIIPACLKIGFVVGGQHGKGVVAVREKDGSWRGPIFITLSGGSIGWQVGAQSTDFVLVFKSQRSVEGMLRGKFTLGADAAVAAGPLGRRAGAATDTELKAEIYSYSRSRGLFAGVSLEGSVLQVNDEANAAYYGVTGPGAAPPPVPPSAQKLLETIARLSALPLPADELAAHNQPIIAATNVQTTDVDALRGELAQAAASMNALVDDAWRQYLALPREVAEGRGHPPATAMRDCVVRYEAVAGSPQYRLLAQRAEFQRTHRLLASYDSALKTRVSGGTKIALPPPPVAERR